MLVHTPLGSGQRATYTHEQPVGCAPYPDLVHIAHCLVELHWLRTLQSKGAGGLVRGGEGGGECGVGGV